MGGGNVTIPPPPMESMDGKPFECPYCYFLIVTPTTRSWNKNLFQDLRPCVCTVQECLTPDTVFAARCEWLHHLKATNSIEWLCAKNDLAVSSSYTDPNSSLRAICPLCKNLFNSEEAFVSYLARHCRSSFC